KQDAEPLFARMLLKALSPEQLFESLMVATQADQNMPREERKKLHDNWTKNLIANFGDDEGNEVTFNGTVVQALLMMNGKDINDAIMSKERGRWAQTCARYKGAAGPVLNDLSLAALNRPPTAAEIRKISDILRDTSRYVRTRHLVEPYQDVFWALLN